MDARRVEQFEEAAIDVNCVHASFYKDPYGILSSTICLDIFSKHYVLGGVDLYATVIIFPNSVLILDIALTSFYLVTDNGAVFLGLFEDEHLLQVDERHYIYSETGITKISNSAVKRFAFIQIPGYFIGYDFERMKFGAVGMQTPDGLTHWVEVESLLASYGADMVEAQPVKVGLAGCGTVIMIP